MMETHGKGPRGPLRLAVGECLVDGTIHQVFACGHTQVAALDRDGLWTKEATNCRECLEELRSGIRHGALSDEEILAAIARTDWDLSEPERRAMVARAKQVWHYVRYGDKGVRFEQGTEGGEADAAHLPQDS